MTSLSNACKGFFVVLIVVEMLILLMQIAFTDNERHSDKKKPYSFSKTNNNGREYYSRKFKQRIQMNNNKDVRKMLSDSLTENKTYSYNERNIVTLNSSSPNIYIDFGNNLIEKNHTHLSCEGINKIKIIDALGRGITKETYLGSINGKSVCVKMVTSRVKDVRMCLQKQKMTEAECYLIANYKLVKEIGLILQLSHHAIIKMYGYCIRSEATTKRMKDHGVLSVMEVGKKVTPYRIMKLNWQARLQMAVDISSLLHYMHISPLGSLLIPDFKQSQFVIVDGRIKLADLDDVTSDERKCKDDKDCYILAEPSNIRCLNNVCADINTKVNMLLATVELFQPIFAGAPSSISRATEKLNKQLNNKQLSTDQLQEEMRHIVNLWQQ